MDINQILPVTVVVDKVTIGHVSTIGLGEGFIEGSDKARVTFYGEPRYLADIHDGIAASCAAALDGSDEIDLPRVVLEESWQIQAVQVL